MAKFKILWLLLTVGLLLIVAVACSSATEPEQAANEAEPETDVVESESDSDAAQVAQTDPTATAELLPTVPPTAIPTAEPTIDPTVAELEALRAIAAELPRQGIAPDITNETWLNTDEPLTLEGQRGKVVLVEFWTFG